MEGTTSGRFTIQKRCSTQPVPAPHSTRHQPSFSSRMVKGVPGSSTARAPSKGSGVGVGVGTGVGEGLGMAAGVGAGVETGTVSAGVWTGAEAVSEAGAEGSAGGLPVPAGSSEAGAGSAAGDGAAVAAGTGVGVAAGVGVAGGVGVAVGPVVAAKVFDGRGSYAPAWIAFMVLALVMAVATVAGVRRSAEYSAAAD